MIKQKHQNIRKKPNIAYHNIYFNENTTEITTEHSEFRDVVFEDVVFDNDRFSLILHLDVALYGVTELLLSNTTSSNTTSLNSRNNYCLNRDVGVCIVHEATPFIPYIHTRIQHTRTRT